MNGSSKPGIIHLYVARTSIPLEVRAQIIDILNQTLATTVDLKTQVKQALWNVKGMNFSHLLDTFNEIALELETYIDLLAERVILLGGMATGTARAAVRHSVLPEYPLNILEGKDHISSLAERLAIYATLLWENIDRTAVLGDSDTAYLYAEVSQAVDKRLWFLDAHFMTSPLNSGEYLTSGN